VFIRATCIAAVIAVGLAALAEEPQQLTLTHMDELEVMLKDGKYLSYVTGDVEFETKTGKIYCDSAVWSQGEFVRLNGRVRMDDSAYSLTADSVFYNLLDSIAFAWGERVELWSFDDSIYAVGTHAVYDRGGENFFMNARPLLYLKYPDSATMIEVLADSIAYWGDSSLATALGEVNISSSDFASTSGVAVMDDRASVLTLSETPKAERGGSKLSGGVITVRYKDELISSIEVVDSARGDFTQVVDTARTFSDRSVLTGGRLHMDFIEGFLTRIVCTEQAYSWYYPSSRGALEFNENSVSGDTIRFRVDNERLLAVEVVGGAIGTYLNGRRAPGDSMAVVSADTVDYNARFIDYNMVDSLITLQEGGRVTSGTMALSAERILFDTKRRIVEAFSARLESDSMVAPEGLTAQLQPNELPVELQDGAEVMHGDYLEYSLDTEKGRIVRSKSSYEKGFYYGDKLFREQKTIFYIEDGVYTTCEYEEPHFHFHSDDLKLIEGDKLIARPVVFYLGRVPVMVIPYYVFPLKRGRHSGFLPFTFGNFERGVRYVRDVGYYWAASEYWDWQGSFDYYDNRNTFTLNSKLNFAKRYVIDNTYLTGSYTRESGYSNSTSIESRSDRWAVKGAYNHHLSPTLDVRAFGEMQSDKSYFTDFSPNLEEHLNRSLKSQVTVAKRFGEVSVTSLMSHTVDLDAESRDDIMPQLNVSPPTLYPFGNGGRDAEGKLQQKWRHNFAVRYSPSLRHNSSRKTVDSTFTYDSLVSDSVLVDTVNNIWQDTTYTVSLEDTVTYRSRKQFIIVNSSPSITLPKITLAKYVNIVPSFTYYENWIQVFKTDQSETAGVKPGTFRTYTWQSSVGASTKLYGAVHPNVAGIVGLRHVISPTVSFSYQPEVNRNPKVRSFTGAVGSTKSSAIGFSLGQDFQAKVKRGETESSFDLLSLRSGLSYNFEADEKPLSNLGTNFQILDRVPNFRLGGSMTHSFYDPETDELSFWSPSLESFSFSASVALKGGFPLFDEPGGVPRGTDSVSQVSGRSNAPPPAGRGGWGCTINYNYSESGRGPTWTKTDAFFVDLSFNFNLTATTKVTYQQHYDILRGKTINNSVNIVKQLHCWSGSLYWVPVGSNRGFGFKLFVTELPEIKIDNGHDSFVDGLQRYR